LISFWRFLNAFELSGDDFGLVFNNAPKYVGAPDVARWFTSGYLGYWDNYPGWAPTGTAFVRPLVNLMLYAEGYLAAVWGDRAYLLADYIAVVATAGLVVILMRRYTSQPTVLHSWLWRSAIPGRYQRSSSRLWTVALPLCAGASCSDAQREGDSTATVGCITACARRRGAQTSQFAVGVCGPPVGFAPRNQGSVTGLVRGTVAFFVIGRGVLATARARSATLAG
jgi:hypothetical protein